jgi:hypothetical protein
LISLVHTWLGRPKTAVPPPGSLISLGASGFSLLNIVHILSVSPGKGPLYGAGGGQINPGTGDQVQIVIRRGEEFRHKLPHNPEDEAKKEKKQSRKKGRPEKNRCKTGTAHNPHDKGKYKRGPGGYAAYLKVKQGL